MMRDLPVSGVLQKDAERVLGNSAEVMKDKFIGDFHSEEDLKKIWIEVEKVIQDGRDALLSMILSPKMGK